MDGDPVLSVMDAVIQYLFTSECVFKIWAEGRDPLRYYIGPDRAWNNFDFWLVLICWLPPEAIPIGNVAFLRLLRLMRLLKLVGKVKQLQTIVMGLMYGLSSVTYILILMLLIFYLFAVMGVGSFQKNDPFHFGSLGVAMLTLFRCSTLEDWSDIMFINMWGCDSQYTSVYGSYYGRDGGDPYENLGKRGSGMGTFFGYFHLNECWKPVASPAFAAAYFIFFTLIAAFVMLSLFIGAVCGGMSDAMEKFNENESIDKVTKEAREQEQLNELDGKAEGRREEEEAQMLMEEQDVTDLDNGDFEMVFATTMLENTEDEVIVEQTDFLVTLHEEVQNARKGLVVRYDYAKFTNPAWIAYLKLAVEMEKLANHPIFVNTITATILAAGVVVGIQTELAKPGVDIVNHPSTPALDVCDNIILAIFTVDVVVKIIAEGHTPLNYFNDSWNCFDFFIVAACFLFMLPFLPNLGSILAMLRLLRLLRVLKLVKALPQLRIIIEALISGFGSITFVTIILFMFFYLYANIAMILFGKNDPIHFGNLQIALLTLFRASTLDDWTDIM